jgi:hypothetical protein
MDEVIRWVRAPRVSSAARTDGTSVVLADGIWTVLHGGQQHKLKVAPLPAFLDKAVEAADVLFPPGEWTHEAGVWTLGTWEVRPIEGGWGVLRILNGSSERASRQTFPTADRARRWAELRFDRSEGGLRGPKPRAGSRSAAKLPDVRVTVAERDAANDVLQRLGMSYAVFVRAALDWAVEHVLEERTWQAVQEPEPAFVPASE